MPSAIEAVAGRVNRGLLCFALGRRGMGIWNCDGKGKGFARGEDDGSGSKAVSVIIEDCMVVVRGVYAERMHRILLVVVKQLLGIAT